VKKLYFIRHGQSTANAQQLWAGHLDVELTEQGIQEANIAGEQASKNNLHFDIILSSPLKRAHQTAILVAQHINYPVPDIVLRGSLIERSFGNLEGTPISAVLQDWSMYSVLDSIQSVEKIVDLQQRAKQELDALSAMPYDTILIVGHAAFGRALRRVINGLDYTAEYQGEFKQIPNAQILQLI